MTTRLSFIATYRCRGEPASFRTSHFEQPDESLRRDDILLLRAAEADMRVSMSFLSLYSFARQVARQFKPEKIILFGSYAYGKPTEDSDVDMLVIMPFEGKGAQKATEILLAIDPHFPIDLLVRTPEQIRTRVKLGDFFMREITQKGKVLYEATHR